MGGWETYIYFILSCQPIKTSAILATEMAVVRELFAQQFIMKITANDFRALGLWPGRTIIV